MLLPRRKGAVEEERGSGRERAEGGRENKDGAGKSPYRLLDTDEDDFTEDSELDVESDGRSRDGRESPRSDDKYVDDLDDQDEWDEESEGSNRSQSQDGQQYDSLEESGGSQGEIDAERYEDELSSQSRSRGEDEDEDEDNRYSLSEDGELVSERSESQGSGGREMQSGSWSEGSLLDDEVEVDENDAYDEFIVLNQYLAVLRKKELLPQ
eukprot:761797-Hanusia_phi.AAC.6